MKSTLPLLALMVVLGACKKQSEYILNKDAFCGTKTVLNQKCKDKSKFCDEFYDRITVCKDKDGNLLTGQIIELDKQGRKKLESPVKNGVLNGVAKEFYDNGNIKYSADYKNGFVHGAMKGFYSNGQLRDIQYQKNGNLYGIEAWYSKDGRLQHKTWNKNGRSVKSVTYNDKGTIIYEGFFDGDNRIHKEYDENGSLVKMRYHDKDYNLLGEEDYKNGKLDGIRKGYKVDDKANPILVSEEEWKDGELNGVVNKYRQTDGSLYLKSNYEKGMQNGEEISYGDTTDIIVGRTNYANGDEHGEQKRFYENGNLLWDGNYVDGKRQGDFHYYNNSGQPERTLSYNENGEIVSEKEYENGQLVSDTIYKEGEQVSQSIYENGVLKETKKF